ncbi:hypothetical protein HK102_002662, partial [Quaeritorhiza haematococci]
MQLRTICTLRIKQTIWGQVGTVAGLLLKTALVMYIFHFLAAGLVLSRAGRSFVKFQLYEKRIPTGLATIKSPSFPQQSYTTFLQSVQNPIPYPDIQTFESCVLNQPRPLGFPAKCGAGFKFNQLEITNATRGGGGMNSNGTDLGGVFDASVTLIVDNLRVPFAETKQYLSLINAPGKLIEAINDETSTSSKSKSAEQKLQELLNPTDSRPSDVEYDAAQLVSIYSNVKQVVASKSASNGGDGEGKEEGKEGRQWPWIPIETNYVRFWDSPLDEAVIMRVIVPAIIWAMGFTLPLMLRTHLTETQSGLRHHLIIHGLPLWIYNLSILTSTLLLCTFVFALGNGFVFSVASFRSA